MRSDPRLVAVDADVLMNVLATGCPVEILRDLRTAFLARPTVASEALYLEGMEAGDPRVRIDLQPLEQAGVLQRVALRDEELATLIELVQLVDDGEAEVIAVAMHRRLTVATDDRKARTVARSRQVDLLSTPEILHDWQAAAPIPDEQMALLLRQVERRSRYRPRSDHPLFAWWRALVAGA